MRYHIFLIGILLASIFLFSCQFTNDKEIKLGKDSVKYDSELIPGLLAQKLTDFLRRDGYLDDSGMQVRLTKDADSFIVQFVADTLSLRDSLYLELVRDYTATLCREVFGGANTSIWLCNRDFQYFARIPCLLVPEARREMARVEVIGNLLYFTSRVDTSEAMALVAYLVRDSFFTGGEGMITEFDRDDKQWKFRFAVAPGTLENPAYQDVAIQYANRLSDSLFDQASVSVELCGRDMGVIYRTP